MIRTDEDRFQDPGYLGYLIVEATNNSNSGGLIPAELLRAVKSYVLLLNTWQTYRGDLMSAQTEMEALLEMKKEAEDITNDYARFVESAHSVISKSTEHFQRVTQYINRVAPTPPDVQKTHEEAERWLCAYAEYFG